MMDKRAEKVYEDVLKELQEYELRYKMTSADFVDAFERGDLPETEEFYRWRVTYQGYRHFLKTWA